MKYTESFLNNEHTLCVRLYHTIVNEPLFGFVCKGNKVFLKLIDNLWVPHREFGPAIEARNNFCDSNEWWFEGKRHRIDGPAVEWVDKKNKEFWLYDIEYPDEKSYKDAFKKLNFNKNGNP